MKLVALVGTLALAGCFSKPSFTGGGGSGSDAGTENGGGDDAMIDAPDGPPPVPLALEKLSAGGRHVCAVGNDTRLWCWGDNDHGQLGSTTMVQTGDPVLATTGALTSGWTEVAAGSDHSCGINGGTVYCWGRNEARESKPSDATGGDSTMFPVALPGTAMKVFAGTQLSCAILANDSAYCWGNLNLTPVANPTDVTQLKAGMAGVLTTFRTIGLGDDHACAIGSGATDAGRMYCWGSNAHDGLGQSGGDRVFATPVETQESGLNSRRFLAVDATLYATCAVTTTHDLHCWGSAGQGLLLNGAEGSLDVAIDTSGTWEDVSVSETFACARTMTGGIKCWGDDGDGAIGQGDFSGHRVMPLAVPIDGITTGATSLATGESFACVLSQNANAWCWGANRQGELGNREIATKDRASRVRLPPLGATDVIRQIVAGFEFTCALVGPPTGGATAYCWGKNDDLQVDGATSTHGEPIPKAAVSSAQFAEISAGEMHVCGRNPTGSKVLCWGDNGAKQLGRSGPDGLNDQINAPTMTTPWTAVAAGSRASCAIADGRLWCWGDVPGDMTRVTPFDFGLTPGSWRWQSLSIGSGFAVGIALETNFTDPRMIGFGASCPAGTGLNGTTGIASAMWIRKGTFTGGTDEYATLLIAASQHAGNHTCIHYTTKNAPSIARISCFGDNVSKQVNQDEVSCNGNAGDQTTPTWRMPVVGAQSVATANTHSCALAGSGQLYCWGSNSNHELADRDVSQAGIPSQVPMVNTTQWAGVTTGYAHTCVVDDPHKAVYCWGENKNGQVGDGTMFRPRPIASGLVPP